MRILDESGNELAEQELDFLQGYLREEQLFIRRHEAVSPVKEKGHYEVVREYPNGGKDVEWVVDSPGTEAREAYDEFETIQRFIAFTEEQRNAKRLSELKQRLRDTDYCVIKIAEGSATFEEYLETIENRKKWRSEINDIEEMIRVTK